MLRKRQIKIEPTRSPFDGLLNPRNLEKNAATRPTGEDREGLLSRPASNKRPPTDPTGPLPSKSNSNNKGLN